MGLRRITTATTAVAGLAAASVLLTACGGSSSGGGGGGGGSASGGADCAAYDTYKSFGDINGKSVSIYTGIVTPEDQPQIDSYKNFERCTGVKVNYEGDKSFEAQVLVRAKAGNPPDLAIVPQPGLVKQLVGTGKAVEAPQQTAANIDKFWEKSWRAYGSVGGKFYAAPLGANVKSFVWYSPKDFQDAGYQVPQTMDELIKLSDTIAGKGEGKPWCAGIESGDATGWPATDWVEDFLLRTAGPEVYDDWVAHKIPFNDPKIVEAVDKAGSILKNEKYVNGGFGGVKSIATTSFQEGGAPVLDGECWLHRQASFYANQWKKGTKIGEDGDVNAFYLPPVDAAAGKPVLGAGEFLAAFNDKPETQAVQLYMNSEEFVNKKAKIGDWITANKTLKKENVLTAGTTDPNPINVQSVEILQDPKTVFRFDGSDQMPAAVGAGSFWKQMTAWITGQDTATTLRNIESSWPKS
jgi:alpha-glucoside transport system substrate-binding protein